MHNDTGMEASKSFLSTSILVNHLLVIIAKEIYFLTGVIYFCKQTIKIPCHLLRKNVLANISLKIA